MKTLKEALVHKHMDSHNRRTGKASQIKFNQIPWSREKSAYMYILYVCGDDWFRYKNLVDNKFIITFLSSNNARIFVGNYTNMFDLLNKAVDDNNHMFWNDASSLWCSKEPIGSLAISVGESKINSSNKDDFDNKFTRLI